jgi:uncharacterized protein (TIGR02453 family)
MAFRGWPVEALEFYEGLEADNTKVYWTEHQVVYDKSVYAPMAALVAELADEFGEGRIFRPYRDVRFSADKSPYKTNIAATIGSGYVHLSADGLMAGAGMYHLAPDQLDRYRRSVADEAIGAELERVVTALRQSKIDVHGTGPLKTVPKGYPRDHRRADLLRNKGLVARQDWAAGPWLGTVAAKKRVVALLQSARPLCAWLDAHVGPSALDASRRP